VPTRRGFNPSLRTRLLSGSVLTLTVALALVGIAIDRVFTNQAEASMKDRLESVVYLILSTVEVDASGVPRVPGSLAEPRLNRPGSSLHGGAITAAGEWRSPSLVGVVPEPGASMVERNTERFRGLGADGDWNRYAIGLGWEQADGTVIDLTIWAAEDPNRLRMELASFRADLWRWLGLAAALIIIGQVLLLTLLLRPLGRVAREVSKVEAGALESIEGEYPRELQPLTRNLNALLSAERENARRYSEALSDLAHALKTPVAVMRARLESGDAASASALAGELDDMERTIRRQLERARRSARRALPRPVALAPVLDRMAESLERLHVDAALRVEVACDADLAVRVDERDLWEICGNLMENAAKYGRGRVRVRAGAHRASPTPSVTIDVDDDGPGIAAADFERVVERGQRGDEQREGQGLGLAIVRDLVAANDGEIELGRSELGGARIRVILPAR
jgi:two-component system sensor histidine kinase PhoQ